MRKFDLEAAASVIAVEQVILDWAYELDVNNGDNITDLLTEDCNYSVGGSNIIGHAGIAQFYAARNERVRTQQKDGVRTQRHGVTSLRVVIKDKTNAKANFIIINFSGEGKPPLLSATTPTIVADCQMDCRREGDVWRIASFASQPIFVGNDPFLNASVVKK